MTRNILVTGAGGFVGTALLKQIDAESWRVRATSRYPGRVWPAGVEAIQIADISERPDWTSAVQGIDTVVHCAARVHVMRDAMTDPLAAFRAVNCAGTLDLAKSAQQAGVRRFVFVSSIKVNGESTSPDHPFAADQEPNARDPYAVSKYEAEQALRMLATNTGLEVVIVRPPLIYGPGVRANFRSMMAWLHRGVPLPFGALHNRRSLVSVGNLASLIVRCVSHPGAANQTFLASDGEDLSTSQLLVRLAAALGTRAWLVPVPPAWIERASAVAGRADLAQRLCGSLQVDISKTRQVLAWAPPVSVADGLSQAANQFLVEARR